MLSCTIASMYTVHHSFSEDCFFVRLLSPRSIGSKNLSLLTICRRTTSGGVTSVGLVLWCEGMVYTVYYWSKVCCQLVIFMRLEWLEYAGLIRDQ